MRKGIPLLFVLQHIRNSKQQHIHTYIHNSIYHIEIQVTKQLQFLCCKQMMFEHVLNFELTSLCATVGVITEYKDIIKINLRSCFGYFARTTDYTASIFFCIIRPSVARIVPLPRHKNEPFHLLS